MDVSFDSLSTVNFNEDIYSEHHNFYKNLLHFHIEQAPVVQLNTWSIHTWGIFRFTSSLSVTFRTDTDLSLTFPVFCLIFPDFSMTGKYLLIFPGFPVQVEPWLHIYRKGLERPMQKESLSFEDKPPACQ